MPDDRATTNGSQLTCAAPSERNRNWEPIGCGQECSGSNRGVIQHFVLAVQKPATRKLRRAAREVHYVKLTGNGQTANWLPRRLIFAD